MVYLDLCCHLVCVATWSVLPFPATYVLFIVCDEMIYSTERNPERNPGQVLADVVHVHKALIMLSIQSCIIRYLFFN